MSFQSDRVANMPPYVFARINKKKAELIRSGVDVIDLGIGDPDLPTPEPIVEKLIEELKDPANFRYSNYSGCIEFREAVTAYYKNMYNVDLDPEKEVLALIGSKEGIANLMPALIDPGDPVLVPDPSYGVYRAAVKLASGSVYSMPLTKDHHFRPDFYAIPEDVLQDAQLMLLNYPGNPTAATVDLDFFQQAVQFARQYNIPIAHDFAYNKITFEDYQAPSILQASGARDMAVEFGSLSKTYNMTGWRIGYAVGNPEMIKALSIVKSNSDTSQFLPIQKAAAFALKSDQSSVDEKNRIYKRRMELVVRALDAIGIQTEKPRGSFFVWAEVPGPFTSGEFAETLLEQTGVVVTPGIAFGPSGEGYFRISLTAPDQRLEAAVDRLKQHFHVHGKKV
ncbi:MAG TPA: LL-diaminopimelate aminotransferase [Bacillales bacterium]|nr:LL-diaminopimelate aminotransferase [Bacillales bacterium]